MSRYTTQLRYPVMQFLDDKKLTHEESNWKEIYTELGLNDYPIFDETYREELNNKIIRHYYMREIGAETFALFKLYLRRTMIEIMPYYNKLYESELLTIDPTNDHDMHYDRVWEDFSDNDSTSGSADSNRNVYQDTPMSLLNNDVNGPTVQHLDYATNVTYDSGSANSTGSSDTTRDGTSSDHEYGHKQFQGDLLMKYRETFLNIDMLIIDELEVCFMKLWN